MTFHRSALGAAVAFVSLAAAPAAAQTDALKLLQVLRSGQASTPNAAPTGADIAARPIEVAAMPVTLKKSQWHDSTQLIFPTRVAIAGYNVGAFNSVLVTGKARGFLTAESEGSTTRLRLIGQGIDYPTLAGIAEAAYADLAYQLKQAGFEVVPLPEVRAAGGAEKLRLATTGYEMDYGEKASKFGGIVNGPAATGVRGNTPINKFDLNAAAAIVSQNLKATVVMPNLTFDFADAKGSRGLGASASAKANLHFGINQDFSQWRIMASDRAPLEANSFLNLAAPAETDAEFGSVGTTTKSDNGATRALVGMLGLNVRSENEKAIVMEIDQPAYRALALAAAKGWNTAFVAQLKAAVGR